MPHSRLKNNPTIYRQINRVIAGLAISECSDVEQFVWRKWSNLGFPQGDDRDGVAECVKDFQGVTRLLTFTAEVMFDYRSDVTVTQAVLR
jgi:hypothetical protein